MKKIATGAVIMAASFMMLISAPAAVKAESMEQQFMRAYERGDYATMAKMLEWLANQGDMEAQYNLGTFYQNGLGVRQNPSIAAEWYRKAAEQGHMEAQGDLGLMYAKGEGVPRNDKEAVRWLTWAAEQGDEVAQQNLKALAARTIIEQGDLERPLRGGM